MARGASNDTQAGGGIREDIMQAFDYRRPGTVNEADLALKAAPGAKLLAGGQTLLPTMRLRLATPDTVIDLSGIASLKGIARKDGGLAIGAMTTHAAVAESGDVKSTIAGLAKLAAGIGDPQVRHRGTIGGSIANNDPAADYPAAVLALGATLSTSKRSIAADDFFQGLFATALEENEILTEITFPIPQSFAYAKFDQPASRFALVGVAVARGAGGVRVAVTGAGQNGVFRWTEAEKALSGSFATSALDGIKLDPSNLLSDVHGNADYRAHLVGVMARRAVAG
jgi:carbon-monoxide dehydrogenase medium subunit